MKNPSNFHNFPSVNFSLFPLQKENFPAIFFVEFLEAVEASKFRKRENNEVAKQVEKLIGTWEKQVRRETVRATNQLPLCKTQLLIT